jgi:Zn-dependent M28 family amino/carboxypeptidase
VTTNADLAVELRRDVVALAAEIGERNIAHRARLEEAARFVTASLGATGLPVTRQPFEVAGVVVENLELVIPGREARSIVIGAHYDSAPGTPGANDNATGVAALLALARRLARTEPQLTLRLAAFVNEEPPYSMSEAMGSLVYARACRARGERIAGMLSLETIGYYADAPNTQAYPPLVGRFYPNVGNFIGFVSDLRSRAWLKQVVKAFRKCCDFPCESAALPAFVPGVGWSDHWSFWQCGYPGVMITDTAPFRYPHYHRATDTPDKIDYERCARVVAGLTAALTALAG